MSIRRKKEVRKTNIRRELLAYLSDYWPISSKPTTLGFHRLHHIMISHIPLSIPSTLWDSPPHCRQSQQWKCAPFRHLKQCTHVFPALRRTLINDPSITRLADDRWGCEVYIYIVTLTMPFTHLVWRVGYRFTTNSDHVQLKVWYTANCGVLEVSTWGSSASLYSEREVVNLKISSVIPSGAGPPLEQLYYTAEANYPKYEYVARNPA